MRRSLGRTLLTHPRALREAMPSLRSALLLLLLPVGALASLRSGQEADASDASAVAERYLAAYEALDFKALAAFYTKKSVWQDPTGGEIGASTEEVVGGGAIVAYLRGATTGLQDLSFAWDERFRSGDQVVNIGTFRYSASGAVYGSSAETIPFEMRIVVVLQIRDGKVLRHTDYTDFSTWIEQLRAGTK